MVTVKILDSRQAPSTDPARRGQIDRMVTYQLDGRATFIVFVRNKPEPTLAEVQAAIDADLRVRNAHVGQTFNR